MTDFVYDGTTLPTGKNDARPLIGPPNQYVTAAEWNATMQAIADLRAAILSGKYHSLASNPTAAVGAAGTARLRSNAGVLEASENGAAFSPVITTKRAMDRAAFLRPEDFGAVGDGATDDGAALEACLAACVTQKKGMELGAKIYATARPLYLLTDPVEIRGVTPTGGAGGPGGAYRQTAILAIASMRAILTVGSAASISSVHFIGNNYAQHGIYGNSCSLSQFFRVGVSATILDGICLPGENDGACYTAGVTLAKAMSAVGGRRTIDTKDFHGISGTAALVSGNTSVTFTGAPDLTTLGLSANINTPTEVWFYSASNQRHRANVTAITATTLTLDAAPSFSATCSFFTMNGWHAINDTNSFVECGGGGLGRVWGSSTLVGTLSSAIPQRNVVVATVASTSGSAIITFTGTIDLWTLGPRVHDLIYIGSGAQRRLCQIADIPSPTSIELTAPMDYTASGLEWATGAGSYFRECFSSDNNVNSFAGTALVRGCGGSGLVIGGQTGAKVDGIQIDYCGMTGIAVAPNVAINTLLLHTYTEACGPQDGTGWNFFVNGAQGLVIQAPVSPTFSAADVKLLSGWGVFFGRDKVEPLGVYRSSIPTSALESPTMTGFLTQEGRLLTESGPGGYSFSQAGTWSPQVPICVLYQWTGTDITLTGTPSINLSSVMNRVFWLTVYEANAGTVTLQDESVLAGSGFRLRSPTVKLRAGEWICLLGTQYGCVEIGRNGPELTRFLNSAKTATISSEKTNTGVEIKGAVANGASAVAHVLDNANTLSTAGALLLALRNNGTDKIKVTKDGEILAPTLGIGDAVRLYNVIRGLKFDAGSGVLGLANDNSALVLGINVASGASSCSGAFTAGGKLAGSGLQVTTKGDSSGTAGAATLDNGAGKSKIASGATSITITNSFVNAGSVICVTFAADPGVRYWVTCAAGSFTLNLSAAAGSDLIFSWFVVT